MAEMSHDEKRAAGWRKLKKYQQHKTSSISSKSTRKKHDMSPQNNGDSYSLFTGFSESQKTEGDNSSDVIKSLQPEANIISSPDQSNLISESSDENSNAYENLFLGAARGTGSVCDILQNPHEQSSVVQESIPIAANIFSENYSIGASNYSDFFDSIKPSENKFINTTVPSINTENRATLVEKIHYTSESSLKEEIVDIQGQNEWLTNESSERNGVVDGHKELDNKQSSISSSAFESLSSEPKEICDQESKHSILPTNLASSAESLRQLSLELSDLIDESVSTSMPESKEMERRNQELAALLSSEQLKCETLQLQLKEYERQISQLRTEASQHQTEQLARLQRELTTAQDQLHLHVQTVGILVGEKAELEAALSKSQQSAKQKAAQVEELEGRLKASRHKVSDLERELAASISSNKQLDLSLQQLNKELTRVKLEKEIMTKQLEEIEEESAELRQNLDVRTNEVQKLHQELQEKQSQLDLSQLKVQQLSLADTADMEQQLESLHHQKVGMQRQIAELQQTVQALGSERDQANSQYQEYLHHVNSQMKSMADKLTSATAENEKLSNREQSLVKHLSDLEKQLQQLQQQTQRSRVKDSPSHFQNADMILHLEKSIETLEEEKKKLTINLDNQIQENKDIQDQVEMLTCQVEELESFIERLKADQPDTKKLLATMESDKVAASRAVGQNQKLKEQLLELEEGFIHVSNDKLELTQQLQNEQHLSKELGERLAQQELEITELRTQLAENEKLIGNLQKSSSEQLTRQMLKEDQIADKMRHYEAQGHTSEALNNELHQSKERCRHLRAENDELRMKLAQTTVPVAIEASEDLDDKLVDSLKASVQQLTMERDQLLSQLQEGKPSFTSTGTDVQDNSLYNKDVDVKEYCNVKEAMQKLEARFTKTMEEIAELSDEKQRLEHLVLQLQGETETIGEYIALYQMQRSILRQRAQEKDEQLARLARDREEVKMKLNELNRLISQLVTENVENPTTVSVASPENGVTVSEGLVNGDILKQQNTVNEEHDCKHSENVPTKTADKIIALLSEIETSTLVEPGNSENFHPCPWCSGRLITV